MYKIKLLAKHRLIHELNILTSKIHQLGICTFPPPQVGTTFGVLAVS